MSVSMSFCIFTGTRSFLAQTKAAHWFRIAPSILPPKPPPQRLTIIVSLEVGMPEATEAMIWEVAGHWQEEYMV